MRAVAAREAALGDRHEVRFEAERGLVVEVVPLREPGETERALFVRPGGGRRVEDPPRGRVQALARRFRQLESRQNPVHPVEVRLPQDRAPAGEKRRLEETEAALHGG